MMDTKEQAKREPLLSYDEANCEDGHGIYVRDFYEAKITSGELRVVKGAALVRAVGGEHYTAPAHCSLCGIRTEYYDEDEQPSPIPNYCPGCGAKITKP
jgi:hypothetical protein